MNPSSPTANDLSSLYKQDYFLWLEATIRLLQLGKLSQLDVDNLLEELEDMGRSEKRAIYSNLKILLLHLLKYRYHLEKRSNSWTGSIVEHRQRLHRTLQESLSLKPYLTEIFNDAIGMQGNWQQQKQDWKLSGFRWRLPLQFQRFSALIAV